MTYDSYLHDNATFVHTYHLNVIRFYRDSSHFANTEDFHLNNYHLPIVRITILSFKDLSCNAKSNLKSNQASFLYN